MDDVVKRLSRELVDAMATAVANDDQVEACHAKAKAAGYSMKVSLEAVIGFASRGTTDQGTCKSPQVEAGSNPETRAMNSDDRRFLRSLRIAADEANQQVD